MAFAEFIALLLGISAAAGGLSWGAERLAERYGANFVGSILLALITTLPEYMFVVFACLKDEYQMAIGSAIGSCTLLITLGYGSVILLATSRLSKHPVKQIELSRNTEVDALYLLGTAVVAFVLVWLGDGLNIYDGLILMALFGAYIIQHWRQARVHIAAHNDKQAKPGVDWPAWAAMGAAGAVVVALSGPFVDSMKEVASVIGISPVVIALVLGPLASEMPEKLTAFITVMRDGKLAEISVCNFIGSKVNHNSLLLGMLPIIGLLHGKTNIEGLLSPAFMLMTALTVVATLSLARRRLAPWQGVVFVLLYVGVLIVFFHGYGPVTH